MDARASPNCLIGVIRRCADSTEKLTEIPDKSSKYSIRRPFSVRNPFTRHGESKRSLRELVEGSLRFNQLSESILIRAADLFKSTREWAEVSISFKNGRDWVDRHLSAISYRITYSMEDLELITPSTSAYSPGADPFDLQSRRIENLKTVKNSKVKRFYERQNTLIDSLLDSSIMSEPVDDSFKVSIEVSSMNRPLDRLIWHCG